MEDFEGFYSDDDEPPEREEEEWVVDCGYPNCCMPGPHFRSECHNAEDIEAQQIVSEGDHEHKFTVMGGSAPTWRLHCSVCDGLFDLTIAQDQSGNAGAKQ